MKQTELRVGNKITDFNGKIHTVSWRIIRDITECKLIYKPIFMNVDLFLKLGFKLMDDGGELKGDDRFLVHPLLDRSISLPNFKYRNTIELKTLHQVQNLFFAITGSELFPKKTK